MSVEVDRTELRDRHMRRLQLMVPAEPELLVKQTLFAGIPEKARLKVIEKVRRYIHFVRYEKGDRTPHPDPEVARIIKEKAAEMGAYAGSCSPRSTRLQDPRRGQGLPRHRHRCDVAPRLRLPTLPRRADVLGRRHRRR